VGCEWFKHPLRIGFPEARRWNGNAQADPVACLVEADLRHFTGGGRLGAESEQVPKHVPELIQIHQHA
jgi:hypothetical protein